jgi:hypothetical protein
LQTRFGEKGEDRPKVRDGGDPPASNFPSRCHPERSATESKDLQLFFVMSDDTTGTRLQSMITRPGFTSFVDLAKLRKLLEYRKAADLSIGAPENWLDNEVFAL